MSENTTKSSTSETEAATGSATKARSVPAIKRFNRGKLLADITKKQIKSNLPTFRPGDTVRVHCRIIEGNKERVQLFEGVVIRRHKGNNPDATFTVRKVSYNVGVERTFFIHSPRVEKIEVVANGEVRRARLYYLRDLKGKAARIRSQLVGSEDGGQTDGDILPEGEGGEGEGDGSTEESAKSSKKKSGASATSSEESRQTA